MTALSGAHTIGQAQCVGFRTRIYNDTNIDTNFANARKAGCPVSGGDNNLAPLDVQTPNKFDNSYYKNLMLRRGLLHSDQELFNGGSQDALVRIYSNANAAFAVDFAVAMVRMGNISPLTGTDGEIRKNCRVVNWSTDHDHHWLALCMAFLAIIVRFYVCNWISVLHFRKENKVLVKNCGDNKIIVLFKIIQSKEN